MISLIFTIAVTFICPYTIEVNHTHYPFTEADYRDMVVASERCKVEYEGIPCLYRVTKTFIYDETGDRILRTEYLCGKKVNNPDNVFLPGRKAK